MTKKILRNAYLVALLALLSCAVLFFGVIYRGYEDLAFSKLQAEAGAVRHGLEQTGVSYLRTLSIDERVTWVDADGVVLFDNTAAPGDLSSHKGRTEIEQARAEGVGRAARYSQTLFTRTYYYAERLANGTVLRVCCTQNSLPSLLSMMLPPFFAIAVVVLMLCGFLSYRLARQITGPINAIDPENASPLTVYPELTPLTDKLREQKRTITAQMNELQLRQREFTAITENMREGFLLVDGKKRILSGNHSASALLGADAQKPGQTLCPESCRAELLRALDTALSGSHAELLLLVDEVSWQVLVNPVIADSQVAGAVILCMDVTEREQRERLRREFSANVSHELKTPLTSISGFAELMKEGLVALDRIPEFASDIYKESQRLLGLIEDILQLSRLDETSAQFQRAPVDLLPLAQGVLDSLRPVAERQNVTLLLDGQHAVICGVEQLLKEMLYNLVDNAIKYNVPGGRVCLAIRQNETEASIRVTDTGIGIPYAHQPRVFERFYRVNKSHSKEVGGTGLGLSIVKHAAQYHDAQLSLRSQPGQGTSIHVRFPQRPPA